MSKVTESNLSSWRKTIFLVLKNKNNKKKNMENIILLTVCSCVGYFIMIYINIFTYLEISLTKDIKTTEYEYIIG